MIFPKYDESGKYITNPIYKEIQVLHSLLEKENISHTMKEMYDGWQICYPSDENNKYVMDAIEHFGSYGCEEDLIEIMGLLTPDEEACDSVIGHLTANEVFERIKQHWESVGKNDSN